MDKSHDPTHAMRLKAGHYNGVTEGTACTQSAFRRGKKSFFFIGEQGGRYKAMFKLRASKPQAEALAKAHPDDYQAGKGSWITARFSIDKPMPREIWEHWLQESYDLSR